MKNLKDTMAAARRREVGIKVCPVCGSTDISAITMTGYITQPEYTCNKCGFHNTLFPELDPSGKDDPETDGALLHDEETTSAEDEKTEE